MKDRCALIEKYLIPKDSPLKELWQKNVCLKYCPLKDACVYDYRGLVPKFIRERLKQTKIPCPKCGARDKWEIYENGEIHCVHCGKVISRDEPHLPRNKRKNKTIILHPLPRKL